MSATQFSCRGSLSEVAHCGPKVRLVPLFSPTWSVAECQEGWALPACWMGSLCAGPTFTLFPNPPFSVLSENRKGPSSEKCFFLQTLRSHLVPFSSSVFTDQVHMWVQLVPWVTSESLKSVYLWSLTLLKTSAAVCLDIAVLLYSDWCSSGPPAFCTRESSKAGQLHRSTCAGHTGRLWLSRWHSCL